MHMVDDATTKGLGRFSEQETTWAAAGALRRWIERYGVPWALYTDWKNVYVRPPNAQERLRGEAAVTQFGRMCAKLGIRIIAASSPQAKGRVERAHTRCWCNGDVSPTIALNLQPPGFHRRDGQPYAPNCLKW
jgi:hypothetical protein